MCINHIDKTMTLSGIRECETLKDLENVFKDRKIYDQDKKINLLIEAMYNPRMFASGETNSEQRYILTTAHFLTMTWKLAKSHNELK